MNFKKPFSAINWNLFIGLCAITLGVFSVGAMAYYVPLATLRAFALVTGQDMGQSWIDGFSLLIVFGVVASTLRWVLHRAVVIHIAGTAEVKRDRER